MLVEAWMFDVSCSFVFPFPFACLVRELVAVWVWNLDRWLSLQQFWESRSGTAEERPDTESTALDGAEAAKSATSATSAKHLDISWHYFTCLSLYCFPCFYSEFVWTFRAMFINSFFFHMWGPVAFLACWSLNVWCFVFVCFSLPFRMFWLET